MVHDVQRLAEIKKLLSPDNLELSRMSFFEGEKTKAEWEIERIFLQLKLRKITQEDSRRKLSGFLGNLEKSMPDVYHSLVGDEIKPSKVQEIRNDVMPPIIYGGRYYAKR